MSGWVLPVEVVDWELGCCGGPLEIGERVSWSLLFGDRSDDAIAPPVDQLWSVTAVPTAAPGWTAVELSAGPAGAIWVDGTGRRLPEGPQRLTGHLSATWHGGGVVEDPARTTGRIQRVRRAVREHRVAEQPPPGRSWSWAAGVDGVLVAVPGSVELVDVDTAPDDGLAVPARGPRDTSVRGLAGWVVDLAVER